MKGLNRSECKTGSSPATDISAHGDAGIDAAARAVAAMVSVFLQVIPFQLGHLTCS